MIILVQMGAWTEEAIVGSPTAGDAALRPGSAREMLAVSGIPWVTLLFLLACAWVLLAAGGTRGALSVSGLLAYGAKATTLILDRGETWRLLSANLLHKDLLHLAFNAFAIWNVGGALERAVRPADYLALIIFTALGTTVASAAGAGSAGVDNWGHGGGLLAGAACGLFLTPRQWPGEPAARRLAAATGALLGTVSMGMFAAPALPLLGALREGPLGISVQVPLGWRKAASSPQEISYTNGLSTLWRSSVTLLSAPGCRGSADLVRGAVTRDLWRLADVGALRAVDVAEPHPGRVAGSVRVVATVLGEDGQAHLEAVC